MQLNNEWMVKKYSGSMIFWSWPREIKICLKNWVDQEISGKITVFDLGEGCNFWLELLGGSKTQGFEKSGFHGM